MATVEKKASRSLTQAVVDNISEKIRRGTLQPGQKLPTEPALMTELGVSRTVVREAISRLQAAGLVETRHGVGTFVLEEQSQGMLCFVPGAVLTIQESLEMLELRISLEVEAASLAALRREESHLEGMRRAIEEFEAGIESGADTVGADFRFHLQLAKATANQYVEGILRHLGTLIIPRTRVDVAGSPESPDHYLRQIHQEHRAIYEAILRRDTDMARAVMRTHLSNSRERLRQAAEIQAGGEA
ncbi:DNA-binding transcriptional regulator, FadR family [Formivibrio citricus]|uniref:DNA-binding transcriptional regulator, FadR family n=1 Tax=Formivibrio citricus TaxID=83765 RepID=A0A1I4YCL4_9NEIS|nr:FadR/GntR family transcriptional regulator [Formivibrio citricus]SFN35795.1 DNA-binding transcriptional regulator, FadR family [Formivibrio citricus]